MRRTLAAADALQQQVLERAVELQRLVHALVHEPLEGLLDAERKVYSGSQSISFIRRLIEKMTFWFQGWMLGADRCASCETRVSQAPPPPTRRSIGAPRRKVK